MTRAALLTISDVAARLQVSERSVRRLTRAGALTSVRVGRLVRYREDDLAAYLAAAARRAPAPPAPRPGRRRARGGPGRVVPLFSEM